jgi:hypothetical protein
MFICDLMTVSLFEIYGVELFDDKRIKNWKERGQIGRGLIGGTILALSGRN